MDIKVLFFSFLFGFLSAQKKDKITITIFQKRTNDSINIRINNNSNDTIKILLDTHGLGKKLTAKSKESSAPLSYIFAALYYQINLKNNIEKGEKYTNGLNYGFHGEQNLKEYITSNTHILLPNSSYKINIDFNELSFCRDLGKRKNIINDFFNVSYLGIEIIKYLEKEYKKRSVPLSEINFQEYFNQNITSNTIKLKGYICY